VRICLQLRSGDIAPYWSSRVLMGCPPEDPSMSISVNALSFLLWLLLRPDICSDWIIGIWLESIPGPPISPPIVFVDPTFVPSAPFVLSLCLTFYHK
jgi:hypothetical protein